MSEINHESAFLFFARNIFFEIYQNNIAIKRFLKFLQLAQENKLSLYDDIIISQIDSYEYFLEHKSTFYTDKIYGIYEKRSYGEICYLYKIIEKRLDVSLSTMIGMNIAQQTSDVLPSFCLNIIPYRHYGVVILTWLKQHDEYMEWIRNQFDKDFNKLINYLCFIESEDFLFSEKLYNETIRHNCGFFKKAFFNRISFPDFEYSNTKIFFNFDQ